MDLLFLAFAAMQFLLFFATFAVRVEPGSVTMLALRAHILLTASMWLASISPSSDLQVWISYVFMNASILAMVVFVRLRAGLPLAWPWLVSAVAVFSVLQGGVVFYGYDPIPMPVITALLSYGAVAGIVHGTYRRTRLASKSDRALVLCMLIPCAALAIYAGAAVFVPEMSDLAQTVLYVSTPLTYVGGVTAALAGYVEDRRGGSASSATADDPARVSP